MARPTASGDKDLEASAVIHIEDFCLGDVRVELWAKSYRSVTIGFKVYPNVKSFCSMVHMLNSRLGDQDIIGSNDALLKVYSKQTKLMVVGNCSIDRLMIGP
jgi:hypothetical protein